LTTLLTNAANDCQVQKEIPAKAVICPFSEKKLMVSRVVMLQVQRKYIYYGQICIITDIIVHNIKQSGGITGRL
jgi:hypothetical protein